jgi:hypothetical protein
MASTYSPSLRIELIGAGEQAGTWNTTTNSNLGTLIEAAIAGYVSVSVTSANQAFTALDGAVDQARNAVIALTTTTVAAFAVYAPPQEKTYIIYNTTAYTATIYNSTVLGNTTAAGTGIAVVAGGKVLVFSDGTNFYSTGTADLTGAVTSVGSVTSLGSFTSAQLLGALTDETGTGANVFATSPTLVTPALGTPTALVGTNITGTAAAFNIGGNAATATSAGNVSGVVAVANGGTGASTLTANNVILGNGTSAVQVVAPSTSGNLLTSNGTTWQSTTPSASSTGSNAQVFTSDGTFTVPAGVTAVKVTVVGGGGNGGNTTHSSASGGGGGGAGISIGWFTGLTPGGTVAVTVGGVSGTSSFGAYASATGGAAGNNSTGTAASGTGGNAGSGTGGALNYNGGVGQNGDDQGGGPGGASGNRITLKTLYTSTGSTLFSTLGPNGFTGKAGDASGANVNGNAASNYGNGGSGAGVKNDPSSYTGGAGSGGIVIVEF